MKGKLICLLVPAGVVSWSGQFSPTAATSCTVCSAQGCRSREGVGRAAMAGLHGAKPGQGTRSQFGTILTRAMRSKNCWTCCSTFVSSAFSEPAIASLPVLVFAQAPAPQPQPNCEDLRRLMDRRVRRAVHAQDLAAGRQGNPTVVNPHPDSPWDQSGRVEACSGAIDPQQGASTASGQRAGRRSSRAHKSIAAALCEHALPQPRRPAYVRCEA